MLYILWTVYFVWILSIGLLTAIFIRNNIAQYFCNNIVKIIPLISIIISVVSIGSFSYVFIFNHGSSIAQLSESFELWSFWFNMYSFLIFSNFINIILLIFSWVFHKKIYNHKNALHYGILTLNIILNVFHILLNIPDA
jgi:uncharacterized membrane protein